MRTRIFASLSVILMVVACADLNRPVKASANNDGRVAVGGEANNPAYFVFNYRISNREAYNNYLAQVPKTLEAHNARIVIADFASESIEGEAGEVTVVLKFDSKAAAKGWYDSPAYQEIIGLRTDNSDGIATLAVDDD